MPRDLSFRRKQLLGLMTRVPMTAADLAWATNRAPTNVTRDLVAMHCMGLLEREKKEKDQRVYYSLTIEGRKHAPAGAS